MKNTCSLSYDKDISLFNKIEILPEFTVILLYTHFMSSSNNAWNFEFHSHSFFELHTVLEGNCTMNIENRSINLKKGGCVLIYPGEEHMFGSRSNDFLRFSLAFYIDSEEEIYCCNNKIILGDKCMEYIKNIIDEYSGKKIGYKNIITSNIDAFLVEIIRRSVLSNSDVPQKIQPAALVKATAFIETNISHKITVKDAADAVFLSTRQLGRIFSANLGISPAVYIRQTKIKRAKEFLKKTDFSIKETAFLCGFESEASFCKLFKNETGLSPKTYRFSD